MREEIKPAMWPAWRYGPNGEAEIFEHIKDVPTGWAVYPNTESFRQVETDSFDTEELRQMLTDKGVEIDPQWPNRYMAIKLGLVNPEV